MMCFGEGVINWEAVGATGTVLACIVALCASWVAVKGPEWSKLNDQKSSTTEVILAVEQAIEIYNESSALFEDRKIFSLEKLNALNIKSEHLKETLDRLISRPYLTDGAINIGSGSISLMNTISSLYERFEKNRKFHFNDPARQLIESYANSEYAFSESKLLIDNSKILVDLINARKLKVKNSLHI